jgi:hypothetical protein
MAIVGDNVNFDTRRLGGALPPRLFFSLDMGTLSRVLAESLANGKYGWWRG